MTDYKGIRLNNLFQNRLFERISILKIKYMEE